MELDLTRTEKLEELERLLQSRTLQGSESLRAFLRFVVLKSVENQSGHLKEYVIATEVFGRSSDYDSRNDSTVRVQAGRLRSKLQEYYAGEGKQDKVIIDLPKGHYAPVFSHVEPSNGSAVAVAEIPDASISAESHAVRIPWLKLTLAGLAVLCLALSILVFSYRSEVRRVRESPPTRASDSADVQAAAPLWDDLLRAPQPVLVAFSNTLFSGTAETGMKLLKPLDSPGRSFASNNAQSAGGIDEQNNIVTDHYTGIGEVMGVYSLADFFLKTGHPFRVKRSLLLTWDDVKTENLVVLGSPAENLLLRDLPQDQDFVFRLLKNDRQETSFGVSNTKPAAGEQATYFAKQEGLSRSQISEDYAVISMLKGLNENYRLLILAGITTFGTQAAAEYVTKPEYVKDLIAHLATSSGGSPPRLPSYFQILIKVKVNGGVPVQISYVTHHEL